VKSSVLGLSDSKITSIAAIFTGEQATVTAAEDARNADFFRASVQAANECCRETTSTSLKDGYTLLSTI
jgi:hypothetical protein